MIQVEYAIVLMSLLRPGMNSMLLSDTIVLFALKVRDDTPSFDILLPNCSSLENMSKLL